MTVAEAGVVGPAPSPRPAKVIVVGSANQDYIVRVPAPPGPGETVLATSLLKQPGGKGANQAVAAARLGGDVTLVASVGDDDDGALLIRQLRSEGVDTADVEIISRGRTGLGLVSVDDSGENSITVVPGTNFALTTDRVRRTIGRVADETGAATMIAQAEVLPEIFTAAIRAAEASGARVIFNLAPFQPVADDLLAACDPLVLNEAEASGLLGRPVGGAAQAARAVDELRGRARSVVVTVGAEGACWADAWSSGHAPAEKGVNTVDTTGAGDAFVGAVAVELARGATLEEAVTVGVRAGTFAITSPGAQSSYAGREDLGLERGPVDRPTRVLHPCGAPG
ncbi:ribokinase [Microlunatus antarcticus]|uniref:Ribokinase n=1 Tax=Microlunatus antarcticus TaxID=53388 RepID=A0A7W5P7H7_9ACTN|nr:ribokinase [Microlunatus antarcticus]